MTATAYAIACVAVVVFIAMNKRIEDLKAQQRNTDDALLTEYAAHEKTREQLTDEKQAHAETRAMVASLEADLIEAGVEASNHANNLAAVLDAAEGKPPTLVRGGLR